MKKLPMTEIHHVALARALRNLSFFSDASVRDVERVMSVTHLYAVEGGRKTIFKKGHIGDALYIIHKGAVEIIKPRFPLPRRPIARLGPGDAFGEMALLNQPYRTASAITDGYTELFVILTPDFNAIFNENPEFLRALQRLAARRRSVAT
jgi:CPA1 family monovalent cation:H+ antiporter